MDSTRWQTIPYFNDALTENVFSHVNTAVQVACMGLRDGL